MALTFNLGNGVDLALVSTAEAIEAGAGAVGDGLALDPAGLYGAVPKGPVTNSGGAEYPEPEELAAPGSAFARARTFEAAAVRPKAAPLPASGSSVRA